MRPQQWIPKSTSWNLSRFPKTKQTPTCIPNENGGGKTSSCQSFWNFNTSQKDIKRNIYSGLASCWHLSARQPGTHWCLCLRGCRRPFHLCHSPGWTYALTFLPIIRKRETWLFNQTKPTTVIPCSVLTGWLGDSIPSRRIRFWKRKTNTPFFKKNREEESQEGE